MITFHHENNFMYQVRLRSIKIQRQLSCTRLAEFLLKLLSFIHCATLLLLERIRFLGISRSYCWRHWRIFRFSLYSSMPVSPSTLPAELIRSFGWLGIGNSSPLAGSGCAHRVCGFIKQGRASAFCRCLVVDAAGGKE